MKAARAYPGEDSRRQALAGVRVRLGRLRTRRRRRFGDDRGVHRGRVSRYRVPERRAPMKLIIQIPCFNEERQLPLTIGRLPREVDGFDQVEWLIIDDGSTDRTVEVARELGVDHVVRLTNHKGLAAAFQAGLDAGLKLGADVIVNTDADNQYEGADIPKLVDPIVCGEADMVVGDRQVEKVEHFSGPKKLLQRLGSWVVRQASSTHLPDTTSGFRAYNREAALQVQAVSKFTYTLETIIQAGKLLVAVEHVPIRTNPRTRESRLFPSTADYVRRNVLSIFRIFSQYQPLQVFWGGALVMGLAAAAAAVHRRLVDGFEQAVDELLAVAAPRSVLDVGCGEGVLTERWARSLARSPVTGIDLPHPNLQAQWQPRAEPNLEFCSGRAE